MIEPQAPSRVIEPQACVAIEDVEHLADARGPLLLPVRWYGLAGRNNVGPSTRGQDRRRRGLSRSMNPCIV